MSQKNSQKSQSSSKAQQICNRVTLDISHAYQRYKNKKQEIQNNYFLRQKHIAQRLINVFDAMDAKRSSQLLRKQNLNEILEAVQEKLQGVNSLIPNVSQSQYPMQMDDC